ncbi:hypothetical protein HYT84_00380 [Candidatus Micrarchaeota archaeon]|nr:hypothetical protein [Candidatus Micrarchaeota archaeon]
MSTLKRLELEREIDEPPVLVKLDDTSIPNFTKDIPESTKVNDLGSTTLINYKWPELTAPSEIDSLKITKIEIKKGEPLSGISKITIRDGKDSLVVRLRGVLYLLRKTSEDVAKSLLRLSFKLKLSVEEIVGYLKTIIGNTYVISKLEHGNWTFDEKISVEGLNNVSIDRLDRSHRERLTELLVDKMVELHSKKLVLGISNLRNVLLTNRDLIFTDLRNLRLSKKPELLVKEFILTLKYLFSSGIANRADIIHAASYYSTALEEDCRTWHRSKSGKKSPDHFAILTSMEKEILSN